MGAYPTLLRPAVKGDLPFLLNSWLNCHRHSYHVRGVDGPVYYEGQRRIVEALLKRALVMVACDKVDPDTIFGWCCSEVVNQDLVVHFVYIRSAFQDHGLGTLLVQEVLSMEPNTERLVYTHQTKAGRSWADKMAERAPEGPDGQLKVVYDPFLLYRTL